MDAAIARLDALHLELKRQNDEIMEQGREQVRWWWWWWWWCWCLLFIVW
jgi:hypothetical protein